MSVTRDQRLASGRPLIGTGALPFPQYLTSEQWKIFPIYYLRTTGSVVSTVRPHLLLAEPEGPRCTSALDRSALRDRCRRPSRRGRRRPGNGEEGNAQAVNERAAEERRKVLAGVVGHPSHGEWADGRGDAAHGEAETYECSSMYPTEEVAHHRREEAGIGAIVKPKAGGGHVE